MATGSVLLVFILLCLCLFHVLQAESNRLKLGEISSSLGRALDSQKGLWTHEQSERKAAIAASETSAAPTQLLSHRANHLSWYLSPRLHMRLREVKLRPIPDPVSPDGGCYLTEVTGQSKNFPQARVEELKSPCLVLQGLKYMLSGFTNIQCISLGCVRNFASCWDVGTNRSKFFSCKNPRCRRERQTRKEGGGRYTHSAFSTIYLACKNDFSWTCRSG